MLSHLILTASLPGVKFPFFIEEETEDGGSGKLNNLPKIIQLKTEFTIYEINNKDLLHSTGNYIQYLVITYNGKESEKAESLCCTPETNMTL